LPSDEICDEVEEEQDKKEANSEVDRLRDVCDEDRLLSVVDEEAQRARRRVEVSLQHHRRSCGIPLVSLYFLASVADISSPAATESKRDEGEGDGTGS
jgi:hypothetical protein